MTRGEAEGDARVGELLGAVVVVQQLQDAQRRKEHQLQPVDDQPRQLLCGEAHADPLDDGLVLQRRAQVFGVQHGNHIVRRQFRRVLDAHAPIR